jgi:Domain of unknown function (DUF3520)/von Willebrand factor
MKMNLDDPKLTAFALDELDEPERSTIARAVAESPEAQRFVDKTRNLASTLKNEFAADLERETLAPVPANLIGIRDDPWFWSVARPLAIAAVLALAVVIAGVVVFSSKHDRGAIAQQPTSSASDVEGQIELPAEHTEFTQTSNHPGENPFIDAKRDPVSTFPLNVETASYSTVRRLINSGSLPSKEAVQVEELVNYFPYDYVPPPEDKAIALYVDLASCPWEPSHRLVRIALKAASDRTIIASEANIQVEFNSARVASYRLLGHERRGVSSDVTSDKIESAKIRAGQTVTTLYEVVPLTENVRSTSSNEMLTVKLRFKKPNGNKSELVEQAVTDNGGKFANAPGDLKFAAAVAEFGMILRDSEFKGNGKLAAVLEWAQEGKGSDANGYRAGFIDLVRKAQALKKG